MKSSKKTSANRENLKINLQDNLKANVKVSYFDGYYIQINQWLLCILVLLTPLLLVPNLNGSAITPKFFFSEMILLVLCGLSMFQMAYKGEYKVKINTQYIPLFVFGFLYWVPSLFKVTPGLSFREGLPTILWIVGYFVIVSNLNNEKAISRMVLFTILGGAIAGIYGLLQYFNLDFLHLQWLGRQMVGKQIMISTFGNTNYFAGYLVPITILLLSWGVLSVRSTILRFSAIALVVIFLGCLGLSGVRSAWLSFPVTLLIGIGVYYWTLRSKNNPKTDKELNKNYTRIMIWVLILIILVSALAFTLTRYPVYNMDWLRKQLSSLKNVHELEERFLIWQVGFSMVNDHPILGVGLGRFRADFFTQLGKVITSDTNHQYDSVVNYINGSNANHMHNDYLQMAAETGLITLSLFIWILLYFYYSQIKSLWLGSDTFWRVRHIGLMVSTLAILMDMIFNFPFYLPANGLLFWVLMGLTVVHGQIPIHQNRVISRTIHFPSWSKWVMYLATFVIAFVIIVPVMKDTLASYYFKKGMAELQPFNKDKSLELFTKSLELNPSSGMTHFYMGRIYFTNGEFDKALSEYSLADEYGTDNLSAYEDTAALYYVQKEFQKSSEKYEQIVILVPNHKTALRQLGIIYTSYLPNRDKAIEHIQKYLSLSPPENERLWFQEKLKELQKQ